MINRIYKLFRDKYRPYMDKLSVISWDNTNKESLCPLDGYYFNYDRIVRAHFKSAATCSADLIYFKKDEILFIEFKNGNLKGRRHRMQLKLKAIEGAFIALFDIVSKDMPDTTFQDVINLKKSYIVVYNSKKNDEKESARVSGIKNHLTIKFGLEKYHKTFFNKVLTLSEKVFMEEFPR